MQIGWTAPNGRLLDSMRALGGTIFFSSLNQPGSDIVVWIGSSRLHRATRVGSTLYVDAEELAVMEGSGSDVFVDAGQVAGESSSILRRSIASLGPPTLPDAGP